MLGARVFWKVSDTESGLHSASAALGSGVGEDDIVPFTAAPNFHTTIFSMLNLTHGETYFFSLFTVSNAGLASMVTANITVDVTPPECNMTRFNRFENRPTLDVVWSCSGA